MCSRVVVRFSSFLVAFARLTLTSSGVNESVRIQTCSRLSVKTGVDVFDIGSDIGLRFHEHSIFINGLEWAVQDNAFVGLADCLKLNVRRSVTVATQPVGHGDAILLDCPCPLWTAAVLRLVLIAYRSCHGATMSCLASFSACINMSLNGVASIVVAELRFAGLNLELASRVELNICDSGTDLERRI